jgi:Asp-tRNA(Asn)/Glu-tRNA(Gln) amidotransferase A subunit family amidase
MDLHEAGISALYGAMVSGRLSARELIEASLERIARLDQDGPALNAIVTVNGAALNRAAELDSALARQGPVGPLHGIPVVVKDCIETAGIPTSFGSEAFATYVPDRDANVVAALERAGAVILAKTTLPDWATSWFAYSSRSGVTRNPYDLARHPGGSSSGTGAAVTAGYATVGLGTDTGGSVRLPAAFCNLVGVRSTVGLISRSGVSPLVGVQDTVGPMGRSVVDVARVFDLLVGFDPADELTYRYWAARAPRSYLAELRVDALKELRIGVLRNAFGSDGDPYAGPVNRVVAGALAELEAGGATLIDVGLQDLDAQLAACRPIIIVRSRHDIDRFLAARPRAPVRSVREIIDQKRYHPMLDLLEAISEGPEDPLSDPRYYPTSVAHDELTSSLVRLMATHEVHALVYPTCQVAPPTCADIEAKVWTTLDFPTNTLISSSTWLPALSVPAGLTDDGLPVGLEILGRPYDEATLFNIGYGLELVGGHRTPPPDLG